MENLAQQLKEELNREPLDIVRISNILYKAKGKKLVIDLSKMPDLISYEQVVYYVSALNAKIIDKEDARES